MFRVKVVKNDPPSEAVTILVTDIQPWVQPPLVLIQPIVCLTRSPEVVDPTVSHLHDDIGREGCCTRKSPFHLCTARSTAAWI